MYAQPTVIDNSVDQKNLDRYAADPAVTLDVTALDLRRLPQHVQATLVSKAETFSAPQPQRDEPAAHSSRLRHQFRPAACARRLKRLWR